MMMCLHGSALQFVERVVESSVSEQLLVVSCLANNSVLQNNDHIGVDNGG